MSKSRSPISFLGLTLDTIEQEWGYANTNAMASPRSRSFCPCLIAHFSVSHFQRPRWVQKAHKLIVLVCRLGTAYKLCSSFDHILTQSLNFILHCLIVIFICIIQNIAKCDILTISYENFGIDKKPLVGPTWHCIHNDATSNLYTSIATSLLLAIHVRSILHTNI